MTILLDSILKLVFKLFGHSCPVPPYQVQSKAMDRFAGLFQLGFVTVPIAIRLLQRQNFIPRGFPECASLAAVLYVPGSRLHSAEGILAMK